MNFWEKLKKPFFCLAPMDDVTDSVFRQIVAQAYPPDVFFTEFTNVDGLQSKGRSKLLPRLQFNMQIERPIVAQVWGQQPENYFKVAKELREMGFDGIDLNMGCPEKSVFKQGNCSALINNHGLAKEIIEATIQGAGGLPVSVKTRIGIKQIQTEEWISFLLQQNLAAITVHGRTVSEQSAVPAHWDEIAKAVKLRGFKKTLIIGNGDIESYEDGLNKAAEFLVDGVMIGRGVFKNLWIFDPSGQIKDKQQRIKMYQNHIKLFAQTFNNQKSFLILRKFAKTYINGFDGAALMREKLMNCQSIDELLQVLEGN